MAKTIKHAFLMFYTLIKHGFSTNQSALTVAYIYIATKNINAFEPDNKGKGKKNVA